MESLCIKTKIRLDSVNKVRDWFNRLSARKDEFLQTMKNEGIVVESAYLDIQGDDTYLVYFIRAENLEKAYQVFKTSELPIDLYFKKCWKEYCSGRIVLEKLISFDLLN